MKKKAKKLDELFHDTLKDIYFAEKKTRIADHRSQRVRRLRRQPELLRKRFNEEAAGDLNMWR